MGYQTEFQGHFTLNKPLHRVHAEYLKAFAGTRRMKRDPKIAETLPDPIRYAVDLPIGQDGEFFVGNSNDNDFGQTNDKSIVSFNEHPKTQPGLWCQWEISEDGTELSWNGGEKFYNYTAWLKYLIKNFFEPWKKKLTGEINWYGEDRDDIGKIKVRNNDVFVFDGEITFGDE